jgi:hypothetical protein
MMYINVDIDESEVLDELTDNQLINELESRNYSVFKEYEVPKDLDNSDVFKTFDSLKSLLGLRNISTWDDVYRELEDLKKCI